MNTTISQSNVKISNVFNPVMPSNITPLKQNVQPKVKNLRELLIDATYNGQRLSEEQVDELLNITWPGTTNNLLTLKNRPLVYEIFCFLVGENYVLNLENLRNAMKENADMNKTNLILRTNLFDREKEIYLSDVNRMRESADMIQGQDQCPRCTSWSTQTMSIQNRSSDEATTTVIRCQTCNANTVIR